MSHRGLCLGTVVAQPLLAVACSVFPIVSTLSSSEMNGYPMLGPCGAEYLLPISLKELTALGALSYLLTPAKLIGSNLPFSMHSKAFISAMKQALELEQTRLLADLADLATENPQTPGHYIANYDESGGNSDDDNSAEITDYTNELSVVEGLETELRDVRHSLEAIAQNRYGVCKYCKKDIDPKRLEARPTSSACISCKKTLTQEL